jgi:uncharacterized protein with FMN-binding domain
MTSTHPRARRAAGLGGLLAGIGLLVALKTVSATPGPTTHLALPSGGQPAKSGVSATGPTSAGSAAPTSGSTGHSTGTAVVTGAVADTAYGPIQVRLTITNGRIVDARTLQTPNSNSHSARIAQYAVPILRQEVLAAQSARIDTVSGATYTSQGYAQSVQSALDHAPS